MNRAVFLLGVGGLALAGTAALAGNGIGGIFNLGRVNTVIPRHSANRLRLRSAGRFRNSRPPESSQGAFLGASQPAALNGARRAGPGIRQAISFRPGIVGIEHVLMRAGDERAAGDRWHDSSPRADGNLALDTAIEA